MDDLRQRLENSRFPDAQPVDDWSQGIPLSYMKQIAEYWKNQYEFRRLETLLNRYEQYTTEMDGLDIHFIHAKSPEKNAQPLIITHGWPGSVVEFLKVIGPLTNPSAHGKPGQQAFHLICPSLPGYGFSGKPDDVGWTVEKIATCWSELMRLVGYQNYFAAGGDWGAAITTALAMKDTSGCRGIHLNMPLVAPDPKTMESLTDIEQDALRSRKHYKQYGSGYFEQQRTRPQTLAYGLVDSPIGQAAWILEKFMFWTDCNGHPENALTRDELIDNVMLYWLSASAGSSARLYWETPALDFTSIVTTPTGISIFPQEIFGCSKRWADKRFQRMVYWNRLEKGGHFAALEQPETYVQEIRACFTHIIECTD